MSGNTLGKLFTVTTFGESHGAALGAVVDGCPPGIAPYYGGFAGRFRSPQAWAVALYHATSRD
jgi:hypothetical protein